MRTKPQNSREQTLEKRPSPAHSNAQSHWWVKSPDVVTAAVVQNLVRLEVSADVGRRALGRFFRTRFLQNSGLSEAAKVPETAVLLGESEGFEVGVRGSVKGCSRHHTDTFAYRRVLFTVGKAPGPADSVPQLCAVSSCIA